MTVVCAGGGGVPVVADAAGSLHGVEAVIDKDLSAALLAERLGASMLVMLTDVAAVQRGFGTPAAEPIGEIDSGALRSHAVRRRVDGAQGGGGLPVRRGDGRHGRDRIAGRGRGGRAGRVRHPDRPRAPGGEAAIAV